MKGTRTGTKTVYFTLLVAILLLSSLWLPSPGWALMAMPDIGIDYSTMKVVQAAKLTGAGMANVKNGDAVSMRLSPKEGQIIFKNIRTNEEMAYPPAKQKGKDK
jgi:hypothetical protein